MDPFRSILELEMQRFLSLFRAKRIQLRKSKLMKAWMQANNETNYPYISHFYQEHEIVKTALKKLEIHFNQTLPEQLLIMYRDGFRKIVRSDPRNKTVQEILLILRSKGLIIGVLSNERRDYLRIGLQLAGLFDLFNFVLSSEENGFEKPDTRFFKAGLAKFGLAPQNTLYVGDDPSMDVIPASQVGMKTALVVRPIEESTTWRNYKDQESVQTHFRVNNLSELVDLV